MAKKGNKEIFPRQRLQYRDTMKTSPAWMLSLDAPYKSVLGLPSSATMTSLLCGAAFGAAMMASGFQQPSTVISQLKFENWHMFQAFMAATASSSIFYTVAKQLGYVSLKTRSSSPLGLFSQYDGNIIGGGLLGAGMALSGACPGVLFTQIAAHVRSGYFALIGALLGGIIWTGFLADLVRGSRDNAKVKPVAVSVDEQLGVSRRTAMLCLQVACSGVIAVTTIFTPKDPNVKLIGLAGGLLIGLAQLVSLLARRSMVGMSGAYEEFGSLFWCTIKGGEEQNHGSPSHQSITFAAGVASGARVLLQVIPWLAPGPVPDIPPLMAVTGGALMSVGSRMAGGCTSGHGISGMSLLSVSSFITIGSAFAMAAVVAPLVH